MNDAVKLTRTERDLLKILQFRESMGTSYLIHGGRDRVGLVVPSMVTGARLSRLRAFNGRTARLLERRGLITIAREWAELDYDGRQHLDSSDGQVVALTDAGRAAITLGATS